MSKAPIKTLKLVHSSSHVEIKTQIKRSSNNLPQLREVNTPTINQNNVIATYKDLNQPAKDKVAADKKGLLIAIGVFSVLALGIIIGQRNLTPRSVASDSTAGAVAMPEKAVAATHEKYTYEKKCYTQEDGEWGCVTKTSVKR